MSPTYTHNFPEGATAQPSGTAIRDYVERLEAQEKQLGALYEMAERLMERLDGPRPKEVAETKPDRPADTGIRERLGRSVAEHEDLGQRLHTALSHLDDLI